METGHTVRHCFLFQKPFINGGIFKLDHFSPFLAI